MVLRCLFIENLYFCKEKVLSMFSSEYTCMGVLLLLNCLETVCLEVHSFTCSISFFLCLRLYILRLSLKFIEHVQMADKEEI